MPNDRNLSANNPQIIGDLFDHCFVHHPRAELLSSRKNDIIAQVLFNTGIQVNNESLLNKEQTQILENEFKTILYAFGRLPRFFANEKIELDVDQQNNDESLKKAARNFLRHLTLGSTFEGDDKVVEVLIKNFINLATEKRQELFAVARDEIQNILNRTGEWLANNALDIDDVKQFQIFLHGLLSIYPFIEPTENEKVTCPQKINNQWVSVTYKIQKIDISPQSGILSKLLRDKDHLYAYGLVPMEDQNPDAQPYLLYMGTSYPTGQGEGLSYLYNWYPRHSVGEAHDTSLVDDWIKKQNNKINVLGQSKGAVMSMITTARHPDKVANAYCFNPTALSKPSLDRYNKRWQSLKKEQRPSISVYTQEGDIVYPLENGFLEGTQIFRIFLQNEKTHRLHNKLPLFLQKIYEAHIHNFAGHESVIILNVNANRENNSRWREFRGDLKETLNWLTFPIKALNFVGQLIQQKIEDTVPFVKVLTRPLSVVGKTLSTLSQIALLIPGLIIGMLISAGKVLGRELFGMHSDYQITKQPQDLATKSRDDIVDEKSASDVNQDKYNCTTTKFASIGLINNEKLDTKIEDKENSHVAPVSTQIIQPIASKTSNPEEAVSVSVPVCSLR